MKILTHWNSTIKTLRLVFFKDTDNPDYHLVIWFYNETNNVRIVDDCNITEDDCLQDHEADSDELHIGIKRALRVNKLV